MTATRAVKATYRSGWCTTGAAAWSHVKCSGTYGHPPYEATCGCSCHDPAGARVDAAFAFARRSCLDIIEHYDPMAVWFPREVAPVLLAKLHAAFPTLWNVPLDKPIEVTR